MPAKLISAPSFLPTVEDVDFDADFDLPEGDTVLSPPNATPTAGAANDADDDDWDRDLSMPASGSRLGAGSRFGTVTNFSLKPRVIKPQATNPAPEEWDDDDDFDLPPPSARPLRLSLSPRTKLKMENLARESFGNAGTLVNALNSATEEGADGPADEEGNASTIKVSRLALSAALAESARPVAPPATSSEPFPSQPADDFEDDFALPETLNRLTLRKLPSLTHRISKSSSDPWGDNTSSTLMSDASSTTLSQPSPCHSSQPSTEDDSDGLADEGDFDGLVLPDSLSPIDMQRTLEAKKKGVFLGPPGRVKVARPSDGEDDFESGLVIAADEDLSPSRLKKPTFSSRAIGKGTPRSQSAPTHMSSGANPSQLPLPPAPHRSHNESTDRTLNRGGMRSPTLLVPGTTLPAVRPHQESYPSLRRAPSTIASNTSSTRPTSARWQTFSATLKHSPSLILPTTSNAAARPPSPTKIPAPVSTISPTPTPQSRSPIPSPVPSASGSIGRRPPSSPGAGPSTAVPFFVKHQKSFSKLPAASTPPLVKRLSRKASLNSLQDVQSGSSVHFSSPSPSPEIPLSPSRTTASGKPPVRKGLTHAVSFRDLGGGTVGPSASVGNASSSATLRRFPYEAPTAAFNARRATNRSSGMNDETTSGSDRERERRPTLPSSSSSRSIARSRGAITNIFPSAITTSNFGPSAPSPSPLARSPSPILQPSARMPSVAIRRPSTAANPSSPPSVKILRRPRKPRMFGDGTELDGIEDLKVEREKESMYRVVPSGRGNVGIRPKTAGAALSGPFSQASMTAPPILTRKTSIIPSRRAPLDRPDSSASSRASMDVPRLSSVLRRLPRVEFPRADPASIPLPTTSSKKHASGPKKKPVLIRNLSGAGSAKVVNGMKWNPASLRWEGNDHVLRDFELGTSTRPALITHLTGSSVGGIVSPPGAIKSLANGAKVVGDMIFDPIKMCWLSKTGEEEDPFSGMDDETVADDDDDDWDADGKGGTIRASLQSVGSHQNRPSGSGLSSCESSPARSAASRRGSRQHARSASESDSESAAGSMAGPGSGGGRESSLGSVAAMTMINEDDDIVTFPVPRELVAACIAAEERHRGEMKGWQLSSLMSSTASSRRRVSISRNLPLSPSGGTSTSRVVDEEPDRAYLHDIRAMARRTA